MKRANFNKILSGIVYEGFYEESDALRFLINSMVAKGFEVKNDHYICSMRGSINSTKKNRIQNYRKSFKAHQIKNELKDVYSYIKEQNN